MTLSRPKPLPPYLVTYSQLPFNMFKPVDAKYFILPVEFYNMQTIRQKYQKSLNFSEIFMKVQNIKLCQGNATFNLYAIPVIKFNEY